MADPAFFGVGVTQSYDNPAEAALLVLVDLTKTPHSMPDVVGGLRVRYVRINRLHVTRSKYRSGATSAAVHAAIVGTRCGQSINAGRRSPSMAKRTAEKLTAG